MAIDFSKLVCKNCGLFSFNGSFLQSYGRMVESDINDKFQEETKKLMSNEDVTPEEYASGLNGKEVEMQGFCPVCGKLHLVKCVNTIIPEEVMKKMITGKVDPISEYGLPSTLLSDNPDEVNGDHLALVATDMLQEERDIPGYWMLGVGYQLINNSTARVEQEDASIRQRMQKGDEITPAEKKSLEISMEDKVLRSIWYVYDHYDKVMEDTIKNIQQSQEAVFKGEGNKDSGVKLSDSDELISDGPKSGNKKKK